MKPNRLTDSLAVAWHLARLTVGWCLLTAAERAGLLSHRRAAWKLRHNEGEREFWRFRTRRVRKEEWHAD